METPNPEIELVIDESDGEPGIAVILHAGAILEREGDVVTGCKLNKQQARQLMTSLQTRLAQLGFYFGS